MPENNDKDIREAALNELKELGALIAGGVSEDTIATFCNQLYAIHSGFVQAGFTEQQAMYLLTQLIAKA